MDKAAEKEQHRRHFSRREFVKASALTVGAAGVSFVGGPVPAQAADKPKGVPLSMARYRFDRTKALIDGRVKVEGCDMQFSELLVIANFPVASVQAQECIYPD